MSSPRDINVHIYLTGGHERILTLPEDAPELRSLMEIVVQRSAGNDPPAHTVQLPMDENTSALILSSQHIHSVVTTPPVLVDFGDSAAVTSAESAGRENEMTAVRPIRKPGVRQAVLLDDTHLSLPDGESIILNASAAAVWQLCDDIRSVPEIVDALSTEYSAPSEVLARDVEDTLHLLEQSGAIELGKPEEVAQPAR